MIYGIVHRDRTRQVSRDALFQLRPQPLSGKPTNVFMQGNIAFGVSEIDVPTIDDGVGVAFSQDKKVVVAASGNIFASEFSTPGATAMEPAQCILAAYEKSGEKSFTSLNGQFAGAIWDSRENRFLLVRDHLGFEPLFYFWNEKTLIFCSSLKSLIHHPEIESALNFRAIRNYLLFNFSIGLDTFIRNVNKVRPGACLILQNETLRTQRYWSLSYQNQNGRKIDDYTQTLIELTQDALKIRTQEKTSDAGAFLSGGMDSSSVVGLLSGLTDRPVHTFSFRCPEKMVDESYFARVMAEHYKTEHHEVPFTAEDLVHIEKMTEWMDEPLCDIGVELGSFILGREAHGSVDYILTGDGGDELYAGHPVYLADKMAATFDKLPSPIRNGVTRVAQLLPDSDKKKSLWVKTRRFAYSYHFPVELLSNRWRIYYRDDELCRICTDEVVEGFGELNNYDDITELYADADGPDFLSRSLYGDYQTLVRFHVDRLRLTRAHGIEARFPLHDYRLIEFSSTIPAELKINGSQVKYIQKKALEGVLPDEIVFRKDKMGHNVPMKNWMRDTQIFKDLINDVLSESAIKKRQFFKPERIQDMLDVHLKKKKDYSHRLYSLFILELWLQKNLDK
ncbi:MAG: asparagine synthetase B family protein [bacterium]